ncbi:MAG: hypothetical protein ACFBSC_00120 [Microcoleaceae cyanobacterium]
MTKVQTTNEKKLVAEIQNFIDKQDKNHASNQSASHVLITLSLVFSTLSAASGILMEEEGGKIAALFASGAVAVQSCLASFPVSQKAARYRAVTTKAENLRMDLEYQHKNFTDVLDEFQELREKAADCTVLAKQQTQPVQEAKQPQLKSVA